MDQGEYISQINVINAKWSARITSLQKDLQACEEKLASLGTPAPGKLPPVLSPAQQTQAVALDQRLQTLVLQFNQANKDWLNELVQLAKPDPPVTLKQQIPWPAFVGDDGKDYVMKVIDRGGIPVTDRVKIIKAPGTWRGIGIEYNW
jgi:hypothetical protein